MTVTIPRNNAAPEQVSFEIGGQSFGSREEFVAWHEKTARLAQLLNPTADDTPNPRPYRNIVLRPRKTASESDYTPTRVLVDHNGSVSPKRRYATYVIGEPADEPEERPPPVAVEPPPTRVIIREVEPEPASNSGAIIGVVGGIVGAIAGLVLLNKLNESEDKTRYLTAEDIPGYPYVWDRVWKNQPHWRDQDISWVTGEGETFEL